MGGAPILDAIFLSRPNRFIIEAELPDGQHIRAHCADRGRLLWLTPETPLLIGVKDSPGRKTGFQVAAAWMQGGWSSLDTHLPNQLVEKALRATQLEPFRDCTSLRREFRHGSNRFDFAMECGGRPCILEVKSVGAVCDGVGLFPDAPTERGRRHLNELAALTLNGMRTAVVFIAQHEGARRVEAWRAIDPLFADALLAAAEAGVEIYAYRCPICREGITLEEEIPCALV